MNVSDIKQERRSLEQKLETQKAKFENFFNAWRNKDEDLNK